MRRPTLTPVVIVLAAVLSLFVAYMGAYYALLDAPITAFPPSGKLYTYPLYRWDATTTYYVMLPAHQIDRVIRPDYWRIDPRALPGGIP